MINKWGLSRLTDVLIALHGLITSLSIYENINEHYVCLLDITKAFDSIPHNSIIPVLKRKGASQALINIIHDQYTNVYKSVTDKNMCSKKIPIRCDVNHGDPLSSLLFNLVVDELFDQIKDLHGYETTTDVKPNARCFADDLILASRTEIGLSQLLSRTITFLESRDLKVNPKKCTAIDLVKAYKGKKSKIETELIFSINTNVRIYR